MCMCSCIFFFMQKTADEMRISGLSSDVCSSDLAVGNCRLAGIGQTGNVILVRDAAEAFNIERGGQHKIVSVPHFNFNLFERKDILGKVPVVSKGLATVAGQVIDASAYRARVRRYVRCGFFDRHSPDRKSAAWGKSV